MNLARRKLAYKILDRKINQTFRKTDDIIVENIYEDNIIENNDQIAFYLTFKYWTDLYNKIEDNTLLKKDMKDICIEKINLLKNIIIKSGFILPDISNELI